MGDADSRSSSGSPPPEDRRRDMRVHHPRGLPSPAGYSWGAEILVRERAPLPRFFAVADEALGYQNRYAYWGPVLRLQRAFDLGAQAGQVARGERERQRSCPSFGLRNLAYAVVRGRPEHPDPVVVYSYQEYRRAVGSPLHPRSAGAAFPSLLEALTFLRGAGVIPTRM